jgi:serine/threonine-protein kinase HipA
MTLCPISYEPCTGLYSEKGLKLLSKSLSGLYPLPFSSVELRQEASSRAGKISIQGVQPKLSARLNVKNQCFDLVDKNGHYILKPQISDYPNVPENEDLTMRLAASAGISVPLHGLLYGRDNELTYFIRRFDRTLKNQKIHVEDFAQLSGKNRDTKYNSSMEQVAKIIEKFCTFPAIEKAKLFKIMLFCFLTGNEDMHLKNFSLIQHNGMTALSPSYDLLNTSIILLSPDEELALPLNGKKNKLKKHDFMDYFAKEKLMLTDKVIDTLMSNFKTLQNKWEQWINISFLPFEKKQAYKELLQSRCSRIF